MPHLVVVEALALAALALAVVAGLHARGVESGDALDERPADRAQPGRVGRRVIVLAHGEGDVTRDVLLVLAPRAAHLSVSTIRARGRIYGACVMICLRCLHTARCPVLGHACGCNRAPHRGRPCLPRATYDGNLLTTERSHWHCGANTAEPKINPIETIPPIPDYQYLLFSAARGCARECAQQPGSHTPRVICTSAPVSADSHGNSRPSGGAL